MNPLEELATALEGTEDTRAGTLAEGHIVALLTLPGEYDIQAMLTEIEENRPAPPADWTPPPGPPDAT